MDQNKLQQGKKLIQMSKKEQMEYFARWIQKPENLEKLLKDILK